MIVVNKDIILIIQSSDTLHKVKDELSSPRAFFRFKAKKEAKQLEEQILEKIQSLVNDTWTVQYLYDLQQTLRLYKDKLEDYMKLAMVFISEVDEKNADAALSKAVSAIHSQHQENDSSRAFFSDMYFHDKEKGNMIILSVISDNIEFTIFDPRTGNTFSVSSEQEVQSSQKKIESVCKQRLIEVLTGYLKLGKE